MLKKNINKGLTPVLACSEIGVIHSLGKVGVPVHLGTFFYDNIALYSKYISQKVHFTNYNGVKFIDELVAYGKKQDQKMVFMSDDDRALLLVSDHRERLEPYYHFLFPEKEMVRDILDKERFSELAREYDLPTPITYHYNSREEFEHVKANVPYPCIVKPAFKQDWWHKDFKRLVGDYKKAIECDNPEELQSLYDKLSSISNRGIVQEFVPGDDDNLFSLNMYVDADSELKAIYLAQKRRVYPIGAGTGCYVITVKDLDIVEKTQQIVKTLQLKGLINVQFKKHEVTGEPKIMEIHVRNSFWNYIGVAAGLNLAAMYYQDLTGVDLGLRELKSPDDYKENVALFNLTKDFKAFLQYRKKGELTFLNWIKTYRGKFVLAGYNPSDPYPIIKSIQFILGRKLFNKSYGDLLTKEDLPP